MHRWEPPPDDDVDFGLRLIGDRLALGRRRLGISQAALARLAGLHQSTISRLEAGKLMSIQFRRLGLLEATLAGRVVLRPQERVYEVRHAAFLRDLARRQAADDEEAATKP